MIKKQLFCVALIICNVSMGMEDSENPVDYDDVFNGIESQYKPLFHHLKSTGNTCWDVLGIRDSAATEEINERARRIKLKIHPDKTGTQALFQAVCAAAKQAREFAAVKD